MSYSYDVLDTNFIKLFVKKKKFWN